MKYKIFLGLTAFSCLFIISCKKNSPADGINAGRINATITGKWNILSDSTFSGIGMNNRAVNYTGKTGDYFDFRTDGNLYIKESTIFDTLAYSVSSDTTISIVSFGIVLNGTAEASVMLIIKLRFERELSPAPCELRLLTTDNSRLT